MRKALLVFLVSSVSFSSTACDMGLAYGDPSAVIVVAPEDWWPPLQDSVFAVLSPDVFTLRAERTFRVTYQAPLGLEWQRLQRFKEEVLIGTPDLPWIAEALATLHDTVTYQCPGAGSNRKCLGPEPESHDRPRRPGWRYPRSGLSLVGRGPLHSGPAVPGGGQGRECT